MKIKTEYLISDLVDRTKSNLKEAKSLNRESLEKLNWKPAADAWSALECIEHLNLYGEFYLREIEKRIHNSKFPAEEYFKSGIFGNYFAESMLPKDNFRKMNTLKDKNPAGTALDKSSIQQFLADQEQLLVLLNKSKEVSLNKTKVPISISKWVRLKLGDILRVIIYHNQRHLVQARRSVGH